MAKNNKELKEMIADIVMDEDELNYIIVLEGDEFAGGAIGLTEDHHVVYDYDKLVQSLIENGGMEDETEAIEWIEYNTIGSLPYMATIGNEPIIIHSFLE